MTDRMTSAAPLATGKFLESANGDFRLRLEKTGNLILTRRTESGSRVKYWQAGTGGEQA